MSSEILSTFAQITLTHYVLTALAPFEFELSHNGMNSTHSFTCPTWHFIRKNINGSCCGLIKSFIRIITTFNNSKGCLGEHSAFLFLYLMTEIDSKVLVYSTIKFTQTFNNIYARFRFSSYTGITDVKNKPVMHINLNLPFANYSAAR